VSQYFIDENLLPIGRALALVRADVLHPGHPAIPQISLGTKDPVWIPIVGHDDLNLVVITRDDHIRRKSAEAALCREHRVRLVVMTGKKSLTMWDNLVLLIRQWDKLEKEVGRLGPGYWAQSLTSAGVRDLNL
jgi:hypothetical protein